MDRPDLDKRCGSCARFVRVIETFDENGEVKRKGECLLMVWPPPLYETNTCSQYVKKGTFTGKPLPRERLARRSSPRPAGSPSTGPREPFEFSLPEELLDMNADEFREILREVIRDELGIGDAQLGQRWEGGEMILKPGKDGTQEKRVPIESMFAKVVSIRDKLRVLEQKINAHGKLTPEEKVQFQGYVTGCYGSLTTFNLLFANKGDNFVGSAREERRVTLRSVAVALALAVALAACGPKEESEPAVGQSTKDGRTLTPFDKSTVFTFDSLDERPVSSAAFRGKPTVLCFVTTGDIVGQAQVSYLVHMAKNDRDRVNYAMIALHPRKESLLVETYRDTLGVEFPVALAEPSATTENGPFGEIPAVPTTVILDRDGRIAWKHTGLAKNEELRSHMHGL